MIAVFIATDVYGSSGELAMDAAIAALPACLLAFRRWEPLFRAVAIAIAAVYIVISGGLLTIALIAPGLILQSLR